MDKKNKISIAWVGKVFRIRLLLNLILETGISMANKEIQDSEIWMFFSIHNTLYALDEVNKGGSDSYMGPRMYPILYKIPETAMVL